MLKFDFEMKPELYKTYHQEFFARPTLEVAPELLGAFLCKREEKGVIKHARIVEVEAYTADDPACHAFKGLTERCRVMFGPAGRTYVYFIYGMYNCLNVVTEGDGIPGAVLIRALEFQDANGPGKLCRAFNIDRSYNDLDLSDTSGPLWLAQSKLLAANEIGCSPRIGISQAQDRLWRFFVKDHPNLSLRKVPVGVKKPRKRPR